MGGLGKSSSEPDAADPARVAGSAMPMGGLSASPVQVSKALKVSHRCDYIMTYQIAALSPELAVHG